MAANELKERIAGVAGAIYGMVMTMNVPEGCVALTMNDWKR